MLRKIIPRIPLKIRGLLLCILSAGLLVFSFPRFNVCIFSYFGFVPLFFAVKNKSETAAFLFSYFTGVIFWLGTIYWLAHVTLIGMALLVLYLALYFGIFGLIVSSVSCRLSTASFLFIPSLWVFLEYIRSHLFTGFGWALLGYSQHLNLPFIQIADITGAWGVSFLVMMINAVVASLIAHRSSPFAKAKKYLAPLLCIVVTLVYGYYKLDQIKDRAQEAPFKVSVVQGNIPQELKWSPDARIYILDRYAQLTEQAAGDEADLIVWPEAASPGLLGEDEPVFQEIFSLSKKIKTPLLIGAVVKDGGRYFNSALLVSPSGEITSRYDKIHLVPFGEYIPLKNLFPFLETVVPIGDIDRGSEFTIFENRGLKAEGPEKFAVLICFEDLFPELSREFVKKGADFLVNITNDGWYKKTSAAYQHFQASVFRAVENRVFLVRSANTGVSGFINPYGRVVSLVSDEFGRNIFISGYSTQEIPLFKKSFSFYTRFGDFFPLACFFFALYGIMSLFKRGR